jgi:acyl-CoA thioester hydrolase
MADSSSIERFQFSVWEECAVRASDVDARGHVNNAVYFAYFEIVRMALFTNTPAIAEGQRDGQAPIIVAQECSYRGQVRYPAQVDIGMRIKKIGNRSFASEYVVCRKGGSKALAQGSSTHAWTLADEERAIPIPDDIRAALEAHCV